MTVSELIAELENLPGDAMVVHEVDGNVTRTGDYFESDDARLVNLRQTTYGGFDIARDDEQFPSEFVHKKIIEAVIIG